MMKYHPTFQMLLSILALSCTVFGQIGPYDFMPFNIIGGITAMSLDPNTTPSNPLRGGSITVDGLVVKIPANTIATLPAIAVAWAELFDANGANPQGIGFEANVIGNKVGGVNIAGLVYIAQRPAQILQGFISDINPSTGHFTVNGVDCVVDDPVGRYGAVPGTTVDSLWTSDPDNPSIHAVNGMPLRIPTNSNTATCPVKNRPLDSSGKALTTWTFPDPAKIALGSFPDPRLMVPLTIGDYVTITGTMNGGTVEVNNLIANLAIFTAPGTKPAYVSCESVNYGIVTTQAGEFAETRAVAWTTDPSVTIQWFAMDVDPCTGAVTERNLLVVQPFNTVAAPGAVPGAPLGRAVFRLGKANVSPATRQVGFRLSTGVTQVPLGPTNLTAGQFIQPIFDFIFPEQLTFGTPAIENRFDVIPFLGLGSGPYIPGAPGAAPPTNPVVVGQLSPWPGQAGF